MQKNIITAGMLFISACLYGQDNNSNFIYSPFTIANSSQHVTIAGDVNTMVYSNYYGKDVQKEKYINPHAKPEYLVYELFKSMKARNVDAIGKLYDTSFNRKAFDVTRMGNSLKSYTDIKFLSKFRTGDVVVIRYNFISTTDEYAYFATIRKIDGEFYLTMDLNIADPFNLVGSLSPNNLFNRPAETVNTVNMTPFYFVTREKRVFFTNQLPQEDYSALYFAFEFYNETSSSPEIDFVRQLQKAAQSEDSTRFKALLATNDLPLLADPYFGNYYYAEIKKIFSNFQLISPLASIRTGEGKLLYLRYSNSGQSSNVASIILKELNGKYLLSLRITDNQISNILQNNYVREAIYDYFKHKSI